jgi:tetratricopeptide (TPR) repeat protein
MNGKGAGIEWEVLNKEVIGLLASGNYEKGRVLAQKALQIAEQNAGIDHPDVASSLNSLAGIYKALGDYAEAEPLYKRSLSIMEKALGRDHRMCAMP